MSQPFRVTRLTPLVLVPILSTSTPCLGPAQARGDGEGSADSVVITPGLRYGTGGLHNLFFGENYRDLWTTPVRVEVLDLRSFAGGLEPTKRGGGKQTKSLRFRGKDGREYVFRSVDKDPTPVLPPELRETVADRVVQDQISAAHPAGPLVVTPFLEAAGLLHPKPRLVILPDDPTLGEFRGEFAGVLGTIEERPTDGSDDSTGFAGARKVVDTHELFDRLEKDPDEHVDIRAYLAARLLDLFLGDWDRHAGQWRWARLEKGDRALWIPIPRDRDQALVKFDGLLLTLARTYYPQLVEFSATYPSMVGLTWNGRVVDRRLLPALEWPVWESTAAALQAKLTDSVIDVAVRQLPPEMYALNSTELTDALRRRRDRLPDAARSFYRLLAGEVEVHGSDDADLALVDRARDDTLDLALYRASRRNAEPTGEPYFRRRFAGRDTKEVRLYLHGGDDVIRIVGKGRHTPALRIIGGGGEDLVIDSSQAGTTRIYDSRGDNRVISVRGLSIDDRPYADFKPSDSTPYPARDWGHSWRFIPWVSSAPDVGLFVGAGAVRYRYGFRRQPYASRITLRAGYATGANALRAELKGDFRRVNSSRRSEFLVRASGIEIIRFHGFGNETPLLGDDEFHRVPQQQYLLAASAVARLGAQGEAALGPAVKYTNTDLEPGRFISLAQPYGVRGYGQVGAQGTVRFDGRDHAAAATTGYLFSTGGSFYPGIWDVSSAFGEVHGEVSGYLSAPMPLRPTLALRVGGKQVWGRYPFHEAAFVGGAATVRGLREQRYAGDASLYGNAELRLRISKFFLVLPGDVGVFALTDVGRVYLEGETSDKWHTGVGGGLWFAFLGPANTVSVALARSEERTGLYIRAGFLY